jgi:hypothetical protein
MMYPRETVIRVYKKEELEQFLNSSMSPFTGEQIQAELNRRDEIERKRQDTLTYPDLSHS